jgi:hypothetical protein
MVGDNDGTSLGGALIDGLDDGDHEGAELTDGFIDAIGFAVG